MCWETTAVGECTWKKFLMICWKCKRLNFHWKKKKKEDIFILFLVLVWELNHCQRKKERKKKHSPFQIPVIKRQRPILYHLHFYFSSCADQWFADTHYCKHIGKLLFTAKLQCNQPRHYSPMKWCNMNHVGRHDLYLLIWYMDV